MLYTRQKDIKRRMLILSAINYTSLLHLLSHQLSLTVLRASFIVLWLSGHSYNCCGARHIDSLSTGNDKS